MGHVNVALEVSLVAQKGVCVIYGVTMGLLGAGLPSLLELE